MLNMNSIQDTVQVSVTPNIMNTNVLVEKEQSIEEHDNIPGFRDHSVYLHCDICSRKYFIDTSAGIRNWRIVQKRVNRMKTQPYICRVHIENFRNFHSVDFSLGEKQVLIGENAVGKSNYYLREFIPLVDLHA